MPAIRPVENIMKMLLTPAMQRSIASALPKHLTVERTMRIVRTALKKDSKLAMCDPKSIIGAVVEASQMGLEVNSPSQQAHLVPFGTECQLIFGYRGLMDLARRSGEIKNFTANVVYTGDLFEYEDGFEPVLRHVPHWMRVPAPESRGEFRAAYAIARFVGHELPQARVLSAAEVESAKAKSKAKRDDRPWETDYDAMAMKTAIRRLCGWLPASPEHRELGRALDHETAADLGHSQIFEAEIVTQDNAEDELDARSQEIRQRVNAAKEPSQEPIQKDEPKSAGSAPE